MMRKRSKWFVSGFVFLVTTCFFAVIAFADPITVIGTVNDNFQIVLDNGTAYEVVDTDKGEEVLSSTAKKIQVTGYVIEEYGIKSIEITAYTIIEQADTSVEE